MLRRWHQRELGQLQTYCDDLHHFNAEQGAFYSSGSDEPLREVCQTCHTERAVNGAACAELDDLDLHVSHEPHRR